jgi:TolB-like protein
MSGDLEQEFFVDGITENITTALSTLGNASSGHCRKWR